MEHIELLLFNSVVIIFYLIVFVGIIVILFILNFIIFRLLNSIYHRMKLGTEFIVFLSERRKKRKGE